MNPVINVQRHSSGWSTSLFITLVWQPRPGRGLSSIWAPPEMGSQASFSRRRGGIVARKAPAANSQKTKRDPRKGEKSRAGLSLCSSLGWDQASALARTQARQAGRQAGGSSSPSFAPSKPGQPRGFAKGLSQHFPRCSSQRPRLRPTRKAARAGGWSSHTRHSGPQAGWGRASEERAETILSAARDQASPPPKSARYKALGT